MQRNITDEEYIEAARTGDLDTVRAYLDLHAADNANDENEIHRRAVRVAAASEHTDIATFILIRRSLNIEGANFSGANFSGATFADLEGANSTNADFEGGGFNIQNLINAHRAYADLYGRVFDSGTLGTDFALTPGARAARRDVQAAAPDGGSAQTYLSRYIAARTRELNAFMGRERPNDNNPLPPVTNAEFLAAARDGNIVIVRRYLEENQEQPDLIIEARDREDHNMTAYMLAARNGHLNVVEALIPWADRDGQIAENVRRHHHYNVRDDLGRTALMHAAAAGRYQVVNYLMNHRGIDATLTAHDGRNAAQFAADNGHQSLVNFIRIMAVMPFNPYFRAPVGALYHPGRNIDFDAARPARQMRQFLVGFTVTPAAINDFGSGIRGQYDADDLYGDGAENTDDGMIAVRNLMAAARGNDRAAVDVFISENVNARNTEVNLNSAAQVAEAEGHADMGMYLKLLAAACNNSRRFIDDYIHQHRTDENYTANLSAAAGVAEAHGHDELAARLTELDTDPGFIPPTITDEDKKIKYNANEVRLKECNFSGNVPYELCCPVTCVIMLKPITVCTGITLERDTLVQLLGEDKLYCFCPMTNGRIDRSELQTVSDVCMLAFIENFIRTQEDPAHVWDIEKMLTCPITGKLFVDPVTVACGLTFEKAALTAWFARRKNPKELLWKNQFIITFGELDRKTNVVIKALVNDYREKLKMNAELARAARVRLFETPRADDGQGNDGGQPPLKKKR